MIEPSVIIISIQYGLLYVLMSIGLTMTYYIAKFANFAQGEYVMISAYVAALMANTIKIPFLLLLPLAGVIGSLVALSSYLIFFRPMMRRGLSSNMIMIGSIGVMLIYEYIVWIFADAYNNIAKPAFDPKRLPISTGGIDPLWLIIAISITSVVALAYIYNRTEIGRESRAFADNPFLSRITGIGETRIMLFLWSVAGFLAGVGGILWASYTSQVTPNMGFENLLRMFATTILGGMTSFYGTIAAGLIVGFAENYGIYLASTSLGISVAYKPVIPFVIIIITLLLYPQGLGGMRLSFMGSGIRALQQRFSLGRAKKD